MKFVLRIRETSAGIIRRIMSWNLLTIASAMFLSFVAVVVICLFVMVALFTCGGCSDVTVIEPDPMIFDCPPKKRCLFDSTGAVIKVMDDSCGCADAPVE